MVYCTAELTIALLHVHLYIIRQAFAGCTLIFSPHQQQTVLARLMAMAVCAMITEVNQQRVGEEQLANL